MPLDPQGGLERPIAEAVNIVDLLSGKPVRYLLRVASDVPPVDLRLELSGA